MRDSGGFSASVEVGRVSRGIDLETRIVDEASAEGTKGEICGSTLSVSPKVASDAVDGD